MRLHRRSVLGLPAAGLIAGLARIGPAPAATQSLRLIEALGKPAITWTLFDLLRPGLQQRLNCDVAIETIPGHDGFDALHEMLNTTGERVGLFGTEIMATQLAERTDIRIEEMTPIAKLVDGFSVTVFARRGSPLRSWAVLAKAKHLMLGIPARTSASYIAAAMMQRRAGLSFDLVVKGTVADVIAEVDAGHTPIAILPSVIVARNQDQLQPILSFGAARSDKLTGIPTFAEVTKNPKLAFTESVGVFASPQLDSGLAARLTNAFILAGGAREILDQAKSADIPLALGRPDILVETMKRNERVLQRIFS
jgi:tripartite-type tricarboxylate transporter receptor subunit TctC